MKCANCEQDFKFSWRIYIRHSSHFNRFITPCCNAKVTLGYKWHDHLFSAVLGVIAAVGIILAEESNLHVALKVVVVALVLFIVCSVDKHLDNKLKVKIIGKGI